MALAAHALPPPPSVCAVAHRPKPWLHRQLTLKAVLTDASPHGVYLSDLRRPDDFQCVLDVGAMASGQQADLWKVFQTAKRAPGELITRTVPVKVTGVLKSGVRVGVDGRKYRSYFVDHMQISPLPGAR